MGTYAAIAGSVDERGRVNAALTISTSRSDGW
jgi:hypothetical protein